MVLTDFGQADGTKSFNMTPIIDIVFLLIIFFLVVCQFIEAENFDVQVPDDCKFAQSPEYQQGFITITVTTDQQQSTIFAVGSEKITVSDNKNLVARLVELINLRLASLPNDQKIVTLRIDKDIAFSQAQYAMAAVSESEATDIQLAALKTKFNRPQ